MVDASLLPVFSDVMSNTKKKPIPEFCSENEEREFWATNDSTEYIDWNTALTHRLPNLRRTSPLPLLHSIGNPVTRA